MLKHISLCWLLYVQKLVETGCQDDAAGRRKKNKEIPGEQIN
jgi:hypothetical protein